MTDPRPDMATWPRERVERAVRMARSFGAVPDVLPPDIRKWQLQDADTVHAADALLAANPAKYGGTR